MNSKQANDFKFFTLFGMLLVTSKLCSMLFAQRLISLCGIILPGGIIPFCITFMVLDIVTNNYGFKNARKIIFFNLLCEAILAFNIQTTLKITPSLLFQHEPAYQELMSPFIKLFTASLFATVVAYLLNCYIFSRLYYSFKGKHLWLRCILATALGELVFSIIWTVVFFWKQLSIDNMNVLVINQYLFKVLFEIITLPITYFAVYLLNKYELDVDIEYKNFKPLHKG
jgi:uncharacterized integral membrane protein (TIGR00697 family)